MRTASRSRRLKRYRSVWVDGDQTSLRDGVPGRGNPWVETHGYFQMSLRDLQSEALSAAANKIAGDRENGSELAKLQSGEHEGATSEGDGF